MSRRVFGVYWQGKTRKCFWNENWALFVMYFRVNEIEVKRQRQNTEDVFIKRSEHNVRTH